MSLNKHMIIGNLGQKPELKHTPAGVAVCSLSVATNKKWKDKAGVDQEKTSWHRVIVWQKLAESCAQYLDKGRQVYVEGEADTREWTDKDGVKRYTTEITAQTVQFLGSAGGGGPRVPLPEEPTSTAAGISQQASDASFNVEDIPF